MAHACNLSTLRSQGGQITRSGVWDQPSQHSEIPSLLKIQKITSMVVCTCSPNYSWGWGRRIAWIWEVEVTVSQDCATALQLQQQSKTPSQNNNDNNVQWELGTSDWNTSNLDGLIFLNIEIEVSRWSEPAWLTWWNPISIKNIKRSQAWWLVPVIPATQKAEAGKSFEPGRQRLQWTKIMPLHSSLGDRVRLCLKK